MAPLDPSQTKTYLAWSAFSFPPTPNSQTLSSTPSISFLLRHCPSCCFSILDNITAVLFRDSLTSHSSPNNFIRSRQHVGRNRQGDLLRRFEVESQFKLIDGLDPQIPWMSTGHEFLNILRRKATYLVEILTVASQTTHRNEALLREHRW